MNECGSFWFWFMRPVAEFLGAITLVAGLAIIFLALFKFNTRPRKEK